jgi:hypothetical protein
MPITSGRVVYSRTVQVAQFEPRKVEVEIAFTVGPEEDLDELLDDAKGIAREEAMSLVTMKDR